MTEAEFRAWASDHGLPEPTRFYQPKYSGPRLYWKVRGGEIELERFGDRFLWRRGDVWGKFALSKPSKRFLAFLGQERGA
jgi:hypothetical protein